VQTLAEICERISEAPADKAGAIRNNAGAAAEPHHVLVDR
jgi:hypothetical protein